MAASLPSATVNKPISALNDDPNGITSGGFMYVPLTDAHLSLRRNTQNQLLDCHETYAPNTHEER